MNLVHNKGVGPGDHRYTYTKSPLHMVGMTTAEDFSGSLVQHGHPALSWHRQTSTVQRLKMATVYASKGTYPGPFPCSHHWSSSSTNPQVKAKEQVGYGRKQQKRQKHRIFRCPSRCQLTAHLQDFTHHSSGR